MLVWMNPPWTCAVSDAMLVTPGIKAERLSKLLPFKGRVLTSRLSKPGLKTSRVEVCTCATLAETCTSLPVADCGFWVAELMQLEAIMLLATQGKVMMIVVLASLG